MTLIDASRFLQRGATMANVPPLARAVLVLMGFNILKLQLFLPVNSNHFCFTNLRFLIYMLMTMQK
jgi:hypothetical protein